MTAARKPSLRGKKPGRAGARKSSKSAPKAAAVKAAGKKAAPVSPTPAAPLAESANAARGKAEDFIETMRESVETAQTRLESVNAELFSAARAEMSEAVEFAHGLARARTLDDALDIQRDYWARVLEARVERARGFTTVSVEAARAALAPLERLFPFARE